MPPPAAHRGRALRTPRSSPTSSSRATSARSFARSTSCRRRSCAAVAPAAPRRRGDGPIVVPRAVGPAGQGHGRDHRRDGGRAGARRCARASVSGVPRDVVHAEVARADIVVDQLNAVTSGVFALEAMALGKPVLTESDREQLAPFARDTPLVPVTAATLEAELAALAADPERRAALGARGPRLRRARARRDRRGRAAAGRLRPRAARARRACSRPRRRGSARYPRRHEPGHDSLLRGAVVGLGVMGSHHARVLQPCPASSSPRVVDPDPAAASASPRSTAPARSPSSRRRRRRAARLRLRRRPRRPARRTRRARRSPPGCTSSSRSRRPPTEAQAAQLIAEAAERATATLGVGHIERWNPAVVALKRKLDEGAIGRILHLHARRLSPFPNRQGARGVALDLATHDIDVMRYVTGQEVARVFAESAAPLGAAARRGHPVRDAAPRRRRRWGCSRPTG